MVPRNWTSDLARSHVFRLLIVFLALTGAVSILTSAFQVEFGTQNFWDRRGLFLGFFFLVFITFFPRLTLIFSSVPFGGFLWWLGFFFAPRILVAVLATVNYWNANPILVAIAWLVAIGGESTEKVILVRRGNSWVRRMPIRARRGSPGGQDSGTVEAEYRVTD